MVNNNKKLIIDDIIQHVNLFETVQGPRKNEKVYELLKVILDTLFRKI